MTAPHRPQLAPSHGPYFQWTRNLRANTVGRWLTAHQRDDYQTWVSDDRRIRDLVGRLEQLGAAAVEADPRSTRRR